jgi:hypothetical protein
MRTEITDFTFKFLSAGHYFLLYTSPITGKEWHKTVTDMTIVDEFKRTETSDHTQVRLNWLKRYIKR